MKNIPAFVLNSNHPQIITKYRKRRKREKRDYRFLISNDYDKIIAYLNKHMEKNSIIYM